MHVVEASAAHERVYAHFYSAAYTPTFILLNTRLAEITRL